jgi:hypothetical protein
MMKIIPILLLVLALSGCAIKRRWVSSQAAYDRWEIRMCEKTHPAKECDPDWKPCVQSTTMAGEQVCQ